MRKRAVGGGRKPQGPISGKSATITTRITPETRMALESAAKSRRPRRYSLSQEIEERLRKSFLASSGMPSHIQALARAVARLASEVERETDRRWIDDVFSGLALRAAVDGLIQNFAPAADGKLAIPAKLTRAAAKFPSLASSMRNPELLGHLKAGVVIVLIENAEPSGDEFWHVLRDLGSGWKKNQKIWDKEETR